MTCEYRDIGLVIFVSSFKKWQVYGKPTEDKRVEEKYCRRSVSALSSGAYITTLLVMVDRGKGGGRVSPTLTRLG
jgi:hypothetical protein